MIQTGADLDSEGRKLWAGSETAWPAALDSMGPCYFVGEKVTGSAAPGLPLDSDWG